MRGRFSFVLEVVSLMLLATKDESRAGTDTGTQRYEREDEHNETHIYGTS